MTECFYCGGSINGTPAGDHIVPKDKGGPDEAWNYVICCQPCNSKKGHTDLYTFLRISGCYEKWDEAKKNALMDKLSSALFREYVNRKYVNSIKGLLYKITPKDIGEFNWGSIQSQGVGLRTGEANALQQIAEIEGTTKNNVTRTAVRYFLNEYRAGRINFQSLAVDRETKG